ncbi:hypothetical protein L202_01393 [Cryptococcus amylolentus CBS 6039]|uniref:Vacuolar membrane protein n=2 Tax=Cryptococcus amylolentus TaxID=104669 RepID=A0A1E3I5V2_9TREE|nr:hypothetical protein L202_01393 [Cryptococcus amylolentus CBS 6039]ODN83206.1 hypothetical protein L202_01393 [Cryptococcus amylolentus CBS 6039]ODO10781.1 hypothetical protein I350_01379 [Cryptococcus amylolentus CBS 6273]
MGFASLVGELGMSQSTKVLVATILGYTSIACWLCAQLPQVLKNLSLHSCEGLALPFLINWLFGDITNLIGCLLTDQLPFQTYLAAYFCIIDVALVGQYIYYQKPQPVPTPRHNYAALTESPRQAVILPPNTAPVSRNHSASGPLASPLTPGAQSAGLPRQRSKRGLYLPTSSYFPGPDLTVTSPPDGSYAAIYEAAIDVARAAERANARSHSRRRRLSRQNSAVLTGSERGGEEGEGMMESFHSDMSGRTQSTARGSPRVGVVPLEGDGRGRSLRRGNGTLSGVTSSGDLYAEGGDRFDSLPPPGLSADGRHHRHREPSKDSRKSRSISMVRGSGGRGSRRTAGITFMSLGLLIGWGGFRPDAGSDVVAGGSVLSEPSVSLGVRHPFVVSPPQTPDVFLLEFPHNHTTDEPSIPHPEVPFSFQRTVGRISAWSCTTLYLTSRLPQIWKNYQRKSVEGLSILLFLMAFCGNVTYVASILLNPSGGADPADNAHYLLESLPYLLGSGGTLMFDLTIMIQSLIYGSAPPVALPPAPAEWSRRRLASHRKRMRHVEDGYGGILQSVSAERGERAPLLLTSSVSGLPGHGHRRQGTKRERSISPTVHKRARSLAA